MNHFFVRPENVRLEDGIIFIDGSDVNHILNVLRMKVGEELLLSDGEGCDYHCEIASFENGPETDGSSDKNPSWKNGKKDRKDTVKNCENIVCKILDTQTSRSESPAKFFLFQALPKADKFEHIIQKSVELGVYEIVPVETARCVVKYDEKKQKSKAERWQKIAESAAKQSHRAIIPEVKLVMKFAQALDYAKDLDLVLIPYENYKDIRATKELIGKIKPGMSVGIFVGPEGGFEQSEVEQAMSCGAVPISLGNRILRTETAPLMLLSVLSFQLEE